MKDMRVAIVIPAFNEADAIGFVLDDIPHELVDHVVVVDNGSRDGTAEAARRHGAMVIREERRGYGAACAAGIASISADVDVIVILDADHSDFPQDLPELLRPIADDTDDFVVGSRVLGRAEPGALPWNQRWGNWLACWLIRLLYGQKYTDLGPFRAIRRDALLSLDMHDPTYGWNVEMHAKAMIAGLRIREVPVRYRRRIGRSKISGTVRGTVLAGTKIISTIFKYYPAFLAVRARGR